MPRCFYRTKSRNNLIKGLRQNTQISRHLSAQFLCPAKDDENTGANLFQILSQQSIVKKVEWEAKFTVYLTMIDMDADKLICVYQNPCYTTKHF